MAEPTSAVPSRATRDGTLRLSVLTASLGQEHGARSASLPTRTEWVRRARSLGITTFDLGIAGPDPTIDRILRAAFPEPVPELVLLARLPSADGPRAPRQAAASVPGLRADPVAELEGRLLQWHELGRVIVLAESGARGRLDPETLDALRRWKGEGRIADWATEPGRAPDPSSPSSIEFGPLSLLEPALARETPGLAEGARTPLIALDPFAGGRLDGSLLTAHMLDRPRPEVPASVRELQGEFAPVLRLGFLTEGRKRTLLEAALQFVLTPPWVLTAVVGLDAPDRLTRLVAALGSLPLDARDLARVVGAARPVSPEPRRDAGA